MARRRHHRIPNAAKLASGVVVVGMCLGMLLATAVNPVMKYSAEPWPWPGRTEPAEPASMDWFDATPAPLQATDGYRPDFDYDEVVGSDWTFPESEVGIDAGPLPLLEEATNAADEAAGAAAAARDAVAAPPQSKAESNSPVRKSRLGEGGLY